MPRRSPPGSPPTARPWQTSSDFLPGIIRAARRGRYFYSSCLIIKSFCAGEAAWQERAATLAGLRALQQRLGAAIRVLWVEEDSHPVVVRSFQDSALPACVLLCNGLELWRHPGLPVGEAAAALLLGKLR